MYDINLLPSELQKNVDKNVMRIIMLIAITVLVLALTGSYWLLQMKQYQIAGKIARIEARLNEINPLVRQIEQMQRDRLNGEKTIKAYQRIASQRVTFTPILNAVAQNMPVDMWLTDISLENRLEYAARGGFASPTGLFAINERLVEQKQHGNNFNSGGKAKDKENGGGKHSGQKDGEEVKEVSPPNLMVFKGVAYTPASIGVFINNLSGLPYFRNIDLVETSVKKMEGTTGQAFCIEARLREVKQNVPKP